ncbi:(E)-4-hydroxy-3-methylbut-2-enyl-diphosphate synthase [Verrucomicrobia bacterium]|nr:(E)-4-hydroxy-3-methylbut-2-enyl-diphosphate synthase [Verrucomicrobiota bacterium]MDC0219024.1 (E)-4-hydroxy-3-methylbut-2-enyl-diphosphate synthase [Verrucomicrobiota bacterium]
MNFCTSPYRYARRETRPVTIGEVIVGGDESIVQQSMITCSTLDTGACVEQSMALVEVGCQIVRITAQTKKYAANLEPIVAGIRARGSNVPVVADIHFKPDAALEAVKWCEMVRVNPGNYADSKKFITREYTDEQYTVELLRIKEQFAPLVEECKSRGRALRIGTNHGSLSDRIMNRFGDTPLGMVESALEFARIARDLDFHNFKFSMKSSNPKVMIECYRLLAARLEELGADWNYPLHLGVTEAGEGEDGRIKSAIGIGSLLCDGLGDTIRVSLTEDSPNEIAVCKDLIDQIPELTSADTDVPKVSLAFDPFIYQRRNTPEIELLEGVKCGGEQTIRVVVTEVAWEKLAPRIKVGADVRPEAIYEDLNVIEVDPREEFSLNCDTQLVSVRDDVGLPVITAFRLLAGRLKAMGSRNPILLKDCLSFSGAALEPNIALLRASVVLGSLLCDGIGDAILVRGESGAGQSLQLAFNILQAAGCRSFKTDYVACPSCGRTLFDLQEVTARIKVRTEHLKGVKIAIMGCIVNGPGEMADADFGYVGGAPGKINLYVGREPVRFNVPEAEAVESLVDLIREHDKWVENSESVGA